MKSILVLRKGTKENFFFPLVMKIRNRGEIFSVSFFLKKKKRSKRKSLKGKKIFEIWLRKKKKIRVKMKTIEGFPPLFFGMSFSREFIKNESTEVSRGILFIIFDVVCIFLGNVATREKGRFHSIYYFF